MIVLFLNFLLALGGKNVNIAVIDLFPPILHKDLKNCVLDSIEQFNDSHGMHVSGIIKNLANKSNLKLYSCCDPAKKANLYQDLNNVDIVNESLKAKGARPPQTLHNMLKHGTIYITSAGNEATALASSNHNKKLWAYSFWKNTPNAPVLFIGNYNQKKKILSSKSNHPGTSYLHPKFANWLQNHFITAPGYQIKSNGKNNGLEILSGTSMSAPYVSSIIALLIEKYDELVKEPIDKNKRARIVIEALCKGAIKTDSNNIPLDPKKFGHGIANLKGAIRYLKKHLNKV